MIPRFFFACVLLTASAFAVPPLTSIQDVLYKADGTRFNGTLTISWNSFQASDDSTIQQQSITVTVTDGNLSVKLVPTTNSTPATTYKVVYNSDGRVQFYETWLVGATTQRLRVPQVRVAAATTPGVPGTLDGTTAPAIGSIEQDVVIGLIDDLEARPIKGPGFAPNRAAMVNLMGQIESVVGVDSDCVRVDGSSGPCGGAAPGFIDNETLSGTADGVNLLFTLAVLPDPLGSVALYRNGLLQKLGVDYTLALRDVQFLPEATPQAGDILLVSYRVNGSESGPSQPPFPLSQVLCSGVGGETNQDTFASLGACAIPEGLLSAGDRIEIRFDYQHQGPASGFTLDVQWGGATVLNRDAPATETLVTGRADAGLYLGGAQLSVQAWATLCRSPSLWRRPRTITRRVSCCCSGASSLRRAATL